MTPAPRFHAVVPAGGVGARLGAPIPKQYLPLAGSTVLGWTLRALLDAPWIDTVVVVVAPGDALADSVAASLPGRPIARLVVEAAGGATRRDSVLGGLRALAAVAGVSDDDWVLVHDAARPGLERGALERLRDALASDPVGALLALPVADTVKRADARARVTTTVDREGLWLAQTPQAFRLARLRAALERHPAVTDEASAIEADGLAPRLVEGGRRNFKVTTAEDLALMEALLSAATPPAPR